MYLPVFYLFLGALLLNQAVAQQVPQDNWIFPVNWNTGISSSQMTNGVTVTIQWDQKLQYWWPQYNPNADVHNSDLWITGYDLHQYQHLVQCECCHRLCSA